MPVCDGAGSTGGLPLGLEADGRWNSELSGPSHPPEELPGLRPALLELAVRFAAVCPGGLPRLTEPRL